MQVKHPSLIELQLVQPIPHNLQVVFEAQMYPAAESHSHVLVVGLSQNVTSQVKHPCVIDTQFEHPIPQYIQVKLDDKVYPAV